MAVKTESLPSSLACLTTSWLTFILTLVVIDRDTCDTFGVHFLLFITRILAFPFSVMPIFMALYAGKSCILNAPLALVVLISEGRHAYLLS